MTNSFSTAPSARPSTPLGKVRTYPLGDIVAPPNDYIGAERLNERLIVFRRIGDNLKSFRLGELRDVATVSAGSAGDCKRLASFQPEQIQRLPCRQSIHGQRACLDVRCADRRGNYRTGVQNNLLAIGTMAAFGTTMAITASPILTPVTTPVHLINNTGDIHSGHVGRRIDLLLLGT